MTSAELVQDNGSSVVFGMGEEAVRLGGETYLLSPDKMASKLVMLTAKKVTLH